MYIFLLGQLPTPIVLYLNWRVTMRFLKVRKLSKHHPVEKPLRLIIGWLISNLAIIFVLIPPITERRFFVHDGRWLGCYAASAILTISGLLLMNSALGEELKALTRRRRRKSLPKPVDTRLPDTL